jgi:hypothetical protein
MLPCLCAAIFLNAACATQTSYQRQINHTREQLLQAGDPDSLEAAALLTGFGKDEPAERLEVFARADAAAPDRPDLIWLHLVACGAVPSCATGPLESRLQALDPGNGAAWAMSMKEAVRANDPTQLRAVTITMASAQRFDIYWNAIVLHSSRALIKTGTMDSVHAVVLAYGLGAALAIPSYQTISQGCKGALLGSAEQLTACRHLSEMLRNGDTYITEMIGTVVAKRSWPDTSPEFQDAVAARRLARYQMDMGIKASDKLGINSKWAELNLRLLEETRTEQQVELGLIKAAGLSPTPPADWVDSKP